MVKSSGHTGMHLLGVGVGGGESPTLRCNMNEGETEEREIVVSLLDDFFFFLTSKTLQKRQWPSTNQPINQ